MADNNERKQNNKNMLRASLTAGGFALSILTAFTFITIGAGYATEAKKAKTETDYEYKKDAEDFLEALTYLANKQYQEKIGVSTVSNYVTGISGVNYGPLEFLYCASAQMHGLEPSLIVVRINYESNKSVDDIILDVKDNYMNKAHLNVISDGLYNIESNKEAAKLTFSSSMQYVENYNEESPYVFNTYEAKTMMAVSFTVQTKDGSYATSAKHDPSRLKDSGINKVSYETSKRMYYALENIANKK